MSGALASYTYIPPLSVWHLAGLFLLFLTLILVGLFLLWRRKGGQGVDDARLLQLNVAISALMDIDEAAILVARDGRVQFINPAAEKLFKTRMHTARGRLYNDLFQLLDPARRTAIKWLERCGAGQHHHFQDCLLNCPGIQELETAYLGRPFSLNGSRMDSFLLLLRDHAEVRALQNHLRYLQTNDQQTRLLNRKTFEVKLKVALDEARMSDVKHSFISVSLDQFKAVNDTLGHGAGDIFIERVADLLRGQIDKRRDVVARIGGDEFGILLRDMEPIEALRTAERVRQAIMQHGFSWEGHNHKITASIGFVPIHRNSGTPNHLLSLADAACRVAKNKGGNNLHVYRPDDAEVERQRGQLHWVSLLNQAFEAGQFKLVAQPIHPLEGRAFQRPYHHYEILIRLYDSEGKILSPDEFIPAAEYYSMMPKLDRWVITDLLNQLTRIGTQEPQPVFSVNLSGQSLDDPRFLGFVLDAIRRKGVSPRMLGFEITERVAINNLVLARKFVDTLRALGCCFSLDDFGTGVSSFGYLKELPMDYLKIDGSFIKDIVTDDVARAMVQSVNQVSQLMAVKTVAEYVENEQIIAILREIGVDYGQGWGISKPIPLPLVIGRHK
ncbi:MAG TPA: EAL domain-containing protein [Thiolinea sp.]|nr:EAL domain-containing protein [Thiolinea sp.]